MNSKLSSRAKFPQELTPEQQKAVNIFLSSLPRRSELNCRGQHPKEFYRTGFLGFSDEPLPKLPHEISWIWNQSNGKVVVQVDNMLITLHKLNTRKKKDSPKPPSYKVWIYNIQHLQSRELFNFLWCEKGYHDTQYPMKNTNESPSTIHYSIVYPSTPNQQTSNKPLNMSTNDLPSELPSYSSTPESYNSLENRIPPSQSQPEIQPKPLSSLPNHIDVNRKLSSPAILLPSPNTPPLGPSPISLSNSIASLPNLCSVLRDVLPRVKPDLNGNGNNHHHHMISDDPQFTPNGKRRISIHDLIEPSPKKKKLFGTTSADSSAKSNALLESELTAGIEKFCLSSRSQCTLN